MPDDAPKNDPPSGLVDLLRASAKKTIVGLGHIGESVEHVGEGLGKGLADVGGGVGRGLAGAGAALAAPESAELAPLLPATDLPSLTNGGALDALAERLDREADLFRAIALRELARSAWVERVTQLTVLACAACEVVLAACAAAVATLGGSFEGRAGLFFLAALFIAMGCAAALFSSARTRAAHGALAESALSRAKELEAKIFRVGVAMEWRASGAALYQEALARLERDG